MKKFSEYIKQVNFKKLLLDVLLVLLGTFIMAIGFCLFLKPNNIVPGGFMGLAQTIYELFSKIGFTAISISLWYLLLNVFLFLFAVKTLGINFGIRAGFGILGYSVFVEILSNAGFIQSLLEKISAESALLGGGTYILYAIFGGVLLGIGMGLVFRGNGSTGGCDMLALVVNKFIPTATSGQLVIIVDAIVVLLSVLAYQSFILPLYALITIFITGKLADVFLDGIKSIRAYYILTSKKQEISNEIFTQLKRTATNIRCEGMYSHEQKDMLLVMVTRIQIGQLKSIVKQIDPKAFMFCASIKEAYGNGFIVLTDNQVKKLSIKQKLDEFRKKHQEKKKNIEQKNTQKKQENQDSHDKQNSISNNDNINIESTNNELAEMQNQDYLDVTINIDTNNSQKSLPNNDKDK